MEEKAKEMEGKENTSPEEIEENGQKSSESELPKAKRRRLSLSLWPKDRFPFAVDDSDLEAPMKSYCTKNTASNNKWNFYEINA